MASQIQKRLKTLGKKYKVSPEDMERYWQRGKKEADKAAKKGEVKNKNAYAHEVMMRSVCRTGVHHSSTGCKDEESDAKKEKNEAFERSINNILEDIKF